LFTGRAPGLTKLSPHERSTRPKGKPRSGSPSPHNLRARAKAIDPLPLARLPPSPFHLRARARAAAPLPPETTPHLHRHVATQDVAAARVAARGRRPRSPPRKQGARTRRRPPLLLLACSIIDLHAVSSPKPRAKRTAAVVSSSVLRSCCIRPARSTPRCANTFSSFSFSLAVDHAHLLPSAFGVGSVMREH
jgi:hypothetical protein